MATSKKHVNLDAMIPRGDFAAQDFGDAETTAKINSIVLRDLEEESSLVPNLRKPDFQRETNHWSPKQVVSLIKSFFDGDLIPAVILWSSTTSIFVIDGGHRLSALRAWILDDYGDGPVSQKFFGYEITESQKKAAKETRKLIEKEIGTWKHWKAINQQKDLPVDERQKVKRLTTYGLTVQWVPGDAEKAEASFFKINQQGTPLDEIETLLIKNRSRPGAIAARSIIRAGMGHKYWSIFSPDKQEKIESVSEEIFKTLFKPEVEAPIKSLDLPLGGGVGVRVTLALLIDFILVANKNQKGEPALIDLQAEDANGDDTLKVLNNTLRLAQRITGNADGSLGLHPAVYFYGPSGRHSAPLFMGIATLVAQKMINNDSAFFKKFTKGRAQLEAGLIKHKQLIAAIINQTRSGKRYSNLAELLEFLVDEYASGKFPTEQELVDKAGVSGKVLTGSEKLLSQKFSDDTKSAVFIKKALENALQCSICSGYLDVEKSVSYDHKKPVRDGGSGQEDNCDLTHPYCNQSIKQ